ncbi:DUF397 domain-containing protein [Micromonospora sp. CPCC 206061]|uniref:DUF397 domain-containing protein n=1 Tax=Micromonospora sp. CPCC 206061 TaxID=3122410 RepID=UPI002FF11402
MWKKSSRCESSACLEASFDSPPMVHVRDSKEIAGPVLEFSADGWANFIQALCDGTLKSRS